MEKTTFTDAVKTLLESPFPDTAGDAREALLSVALPPTGAAFIAYGFIKKCVSGDVSAVKLLREITGEAEPQPIINLSGTSSFAAFTDAQLENLLEKELCK